MKVNLIVAITFGFFLISIIITFSLINTRCVVLWEIFPPFSYNLLLQLIIEQAIYIHRWTFFKRKKFIFLTWRFLWGERKGRLSSDLLHGRHEIKILVLLLHFYLHILDYYQIFNFLSKFLILQLLALFFKYSIMPLLHLWMRGFAPVERGHPHTTSVWEACHLQP